MWTNDQQNAISAPVSNLLVTAAAGSGKTAVMVERIINRILKNDGVDIDKLLIVTFTNSAASEIKERIHLKILEEIDRAGESCVLNRQLALIDNASICTIHSFCLNLIKENFNALSIDPDFKTGDTKQVDLLLDNAVDAVFDKYYDAQDSAFLQLIKLYSPKTDKKFADEVKNLYKFSLTFSSPQKWRADIYKTYSEKNFENHKNILCEKCRAELEYSVKLYDKIFSICHLHGVEGGLLDFLSDEKGFFEDLLAKIYDWNSVYKIVSDFTFPRLNPKLSKENDKSVMEEINSLRKQAKEGWKTCAAVFDSTEEEICEDFEKNAPLIEKLVEITDEVDEKFKCLKNDRNIIDFSDYEHLALKILRNDDGSQSELAKEISKNFAEIYVDEYQDCNEIQDEIFSLVSNGKNVFMVGDVKQSIYKFRDAAPMIFKSKIDTFLPYDEKNYNENVKIKLSKNFRSRKTVLNGVNVIFSKIMSDEVGEMNYSEEDFLYENENEFYSDELYKNISVNIIDYEKSKISDENESSNEASKLTLEASFAAQEISRLINDENAFVFDKNLGRKRRVEYKDIVILMRSTKDSAAEYENVFSQNNIPCFAESGSTYYESSEIKTLTSLAKAALNPLDDINLTAVMRSGIYKFCDEDFLKIRLCLENTYFYDAMCKYVLENTDELSNRISSFLNDLSKFADAAKYMSTDEFLRFAVRETDYMSYVGTLNLAEQKKANIRALFYKAECFEKTAYKGIFNFLRFVDDITLKKGDGDAPKIVSENDNVVRIMTIHKSKGLEFSVVFLCQCAKKINFRDTSGDMILHKKLGLGLNFVDYEKRFSYPAITKKAIADKMKLETLSEEERILYVALTRAKEKLYISGCVENAQKKIDSFSDVLQLYNSKDVPTALTRGAKCYLDWIIPAVLRHFEEKNDIFELNVVRTSDIEVSDFEIEPEKIVFFDNFDKSNHECSEIIKNRLSYQYPHKSACDFPSLITVTELKRLLSEENDGYNLYEENTLPVPKFLEKDKISAAKKGTLMHYVMQKIEFSGVNNLPDAKKQVDDLFEKGFLTEDERDCIDCEKIFDFCNSKIGDKIKNAALCEREFSFKIPIKMSEIFNTPDDDVVIVQGAIDLFFEDDDGSVVIIDYKTDKVRDANEIRKKYEIQLKYYKAALEKILQKKVSKTYIYLFDTNEFV
ncbi:MAG: helicase-exonuclease AddAB subunit AddA [Clostridia bacterium]|nr:helicase-exonuclease AddAB subunit AddA [Clostridia bacterium]